MLLSALAACAPAAPAPHESPRAEPPPAADHATPVVVPNPEHGDSVWLAHASGTLARIWPPSDAAPIVWTISGISGSDRMKPSATATHVAYVQSGVLSIHDRQRHTTTEIARTREPERVLVITEWSHDGSSLLYALSSRDEPSDDSYFRYDLRTGITTPVRMPGEYAGWLPTGDLLVHAHSELLVASGGTERSLTLGLIASPQLAIRADGTQVATFVSTEAAHGIEQLVSIDTRTAQRTPIGPPRAFGTLQWPKWSPSGAKLACLESERDGHEKRQSAWVDGMRLGSPSADLYDFEWIDDETLVLVYTKQLQVVSARTGAVQSHAALP